MEIAVEFSYSPRSSRLNEGEERSSLDTYRGNSVLRWELDFVRAGLGKQQINP